MCGRLNIHDSAAIQKLLEILGIRIFPARAPRYNVTPSSQVDVIFNDYQLASMAWGIEFGKFRHPNSKTETIKRKLNLRQLLMTQRCLVPVNRFYEWPDAKVRPKYKGIKTRFCIHTPEDVMLLAGIYKINHQGEYQFNVITTDPSPEIADFHHRMPVIIDPDQVRVWMGSNQFEDLVSLMVPYEKQLRIYRCSAYVDNGRHEGEKCMEPESEGNIV